MRNDHPDIFTRFTTRTAKVLGHAWVFVAAVAVLIVWACTGPLLGFSDTWQLVINTSTTIVTFLMVFIIQNTQSRDTAALHLKLDALMLELKVSNAKLYDGSGHGQKLGRRGEDSEADDERPRPDRRGLPNRGQHERRDRHAERSGGHIRPR